MTVQSSFLIRCSLKAYYIQHVQTGAEFRSATIDELTRWVAEQNLRFRSAMANPTPGTEKDLQ